MVAQVDRVADLFLGHRAVIDDSESDDGAGALQVGSVTGVRLCEAAEGLAAR